MAIANDCPFGLGSSVFSGSRRRARRIAAQLEVRGWAGGRRWVWLSACTAAASRHATPCSPAHLPSPPMQAGMTSINDFATTYMCQSLPFGGVKHSGFDRFAGIEGLRGMCIPKVRRAPGWLPARLPACYLLRLTLPCPPPHALPHLPQAVAEDRWPFSTAIPPLLQYPISDKAFSFVSSLVWMFYAPSWAGACAALQDCGAAVGDGGCPCGCVAARGCVC